MEFNNENYKKSLENIKASEDFLSETKRLMLKEAEKAEKTSLKPHITKITSFAAAAACIAIIAVIGSNLSADKGIETTLTEQTTAYTTEPSAVTQAETETAEEEPVISPIAEEITEDVADKAGDTAEPETIVSNIPEENTMSEEETTTVAVSEPAPDDAAPAPFAVNTFLNDTSENETIDYEADENETIDYEADENEAVVSGDGSLSVTPNTSEEIVEDDYDDAGTDDDCSELPTDEEDFPVAPAFTQIMGGKAADFPDFSPSDTEKLCEFLSIVSQDDINAEVSVPEQTPDDIFGEKALALNAKFLQTAENLTPCEDTDFEPELTFSVFDNKNGALLYSVQIDEKTIAVSVKHGETIFFETSENISEAVHILL